MADRKESNLRAPPEPEPEPEPEPQAGSPDTQEAGSRRRRKDPLSPEDLRRVALVAFALAAVVLIALIFVPMEISPLRRSALGLLLAVMIATALFLFWPLEDKFKSPWITIGGPAGLALVLLFIFNQFLPVVSATSSTEAYYDVQWRKLEDRDWELTKGPCARDVILLGESSSDLRVYTVVNPPTQEDSHPDAPRAVVGFLVRGAGALEKAVDIRIRVGSGKAAGLTLDPHRDPRIVSVKLPEYE